MSKGFSIIEFMIVVAICGIVAAIAVPNLKRMYDPETELTRIADKKASCVALKKKYDAVAPSADGVSDYMKNIITECKAVGSWPTAEPSPAK